MSSLTANPDRFSTLPDEAALNTSVVALEKHEFSAEVVDDLDAARKAVLARIPEGSSVTTNTLVTLAETRHRIVSGQLRSPVRRAGR